MQHKAFISYNEIMILKKALFLVIKLDNATETK